MNEKSMDRRSRMTRTILKQSLIELMKTKPLHEISIKKICETADINRSTFYHHYDSPYALYEDIVDEVLLTMLIITKKHRYSDNRLLKILQESLTYIENNQDLFLVILSENGNIGIGEKLSKNFEKFIDTQMHSDFSVYCSQFITAGLTSIVWRWLNTENRRPPKDLAVVINTLVIHGVGRAMRLKGNDIN